MSVLSDRDRLEDELEALEFVISEAELWTPEISKAYIRYEEIQRLIRTLGKKDWFK